MPSNDYTTEALINRITLKAYTSASRSLSDQQILDLANDSLRSYIVPLASTLREEWWVGKTDIVVTTDANGAVTIPDSVASTLRTVAWNNAGILTPLTRVEPEAAFQYQPQTGMPLGFTLRGYTLFVLPSTPGIVLHLACMLRPLQMVLTENAAEVSSRVSNVLNLVSVPLAWQEEAPTVVTVVKGASPFSPVETYDVVFLDVPNKQIIIGVTDDSYQSIEAGDYVSDEDTSPFANIPVELYPLLEVDVIATLFQGLGDKRLKGILDRKKELEMMAKRTMAPRTQGNARPIVNPAAPGMRGYMGIWPRR